MMSDTPQLAILAENLRVGDIMWDDTSYPPRAAQVTSHEVVDGWARWHTLTKDGSDTTWAQPAHTPVLMVSVAPANNSDWNV